MDRWMDRWIDGLTDRGGERRKGCTEKMDMGQEGSQLTKQNRLEKSIALLIKMSQKNVSIQG